MIVLASQSAGRLSTLRAAGIEPVVRVSGVNEPAVLEDLAAVHAQRGQEPPTWAEQVQALATAKAQDVAASPDLAALAANQHREGAAAPFVPDTPLLVVGADSMLEIDGALVGKPANAQVAIQRWEAMRAATGVLHTGHCVVRVDTGAVATGVSSTVVHFASPSREEIEAYVATGEPLWCAGAFTIDGLGGAFIESVEGDPHGVVGLSLPLLRRLVGELGVRWTDLWNRAGATL